MNGFTGTLRYIHHSCLGHAADDGCRAGPMMPGKAEAPSSKGRHRAGRAVAISRPVLLRRLRSSFASALLPPRIHPPLPPRPRRR